MRAIVVHDNLSQLAEQINQEHRQCEKSMCEGLAHAINAGNLLIEAKSLCPHGAWGEWLRDNCEVSERTAQAYMRVARSLPMLEAKPQRVAVLSFREAVKLLEEPQHANMLNFLASETECEELWRIGDDETVDILGRVRALNALRRIVFERTVGSV